MEKSPTKKPHWAKLLTWVLFGALTVAGCAIGGKRWIEAEKVEGFHRALAHRQETSLEEWKGERIAGEDAVTYVANRSFFLIHFHGVEIPPDFDLDQVVVDFLPNVSKRFPYGGVELNPREEEKGDSSASDKNRETPPYTAGGGTATPITDDGYFLTNAHVVEEENAPFYLWGPTDQGKRLFRTRTVWRGDHGHNDLPDLALLHADVRPAGHFPLARNELPPVGESIIAGGFGGLTPSQSGGRMLIHGIWRKWDNDTRWRAFVHDAALHPGDSGGPVTNRNGNLVGINSQVFGGLRWPRGELENYRARALQPDHRWLQDIIAADRELAEK